MNNVIQIEGRVSRSRASTKENPRPSVCDRLSRTRVSSQRQLPTDHDHAVPTREYQLDQSSPLPATAAADLVLDRKRLRPSHLDRSLHITDGSWFLYVAGNSASENRLIRMPASGGPSEEIIDGRDMQNYYCTTATANLCVIGKREQDQLVFYAFDPAQKLPPGGIPWGDLRELARTDYNPSDWGLSPDGASIAMVRPSNRDGRIHVISLQDRGRTSRDVGTAPAHDIVVEGWTYLFDLNWAADGKGWYIGPAPTLQAQRSSTSISKATRPFSSPKREWNRPRRYRLPTGVTWPFLKPHSPRMRGCSKISSSAIRTENVSPVRFRRT